MKNLFYVIFAAAVINSVVFGGRQTIPLSIEGISFKDTLNYLQISFAFALGQLVSGAIGPVGGAISDKFGSGKTLLIGITLVCTWVVFNTNFRYSAYSRFICRHPVCGRGWHSGLTCCYVCC